jgi:hypothetical protein
VIKLHLILLESQELVDFCFHVFAVFTSHVLVLVGTSQGSSSSYLSLSSFCLLIKTESARLPRLDHIAGYFKPREVTGPLSNRVIGFKSHFRRESNKIMLLFGCVNSTYMTVATNSDALDRVAFRDAIGSLKQGRLL